MSYFCKTLYKEYAIFSYFNSEKPCFLIVLYSFFLPGEGNGNPFQYSCLENPMGQRSLEGYSPLGHFFKFPWWLSGKESTCQCRRYGLDPWVGKIPWRRKWQLTPVFLLRKYHGQRSLVGYGLWGRKRVRHDLVTKQE